MHFLEKITGRKERLSNTGGKSNYQSNRNPYKVKEINKRQREQENHEGWWLFILDRLRRVFSSGSQFICCGWLRSEGAPLAKVRMEKMSSEFLRKVLRFKHLQPKPQGVLDDFRSHRKHSAFSSRCSKTE